MFESLGSGKKDGVVLGSCKMRCIVAIGYAHHVGRKLNARP
jgi:hypothetical protein